MRKTHSTITSLKPNEVFVFGSNLSGFHGAGAAGLAMRGTSSNNWREDSSFLAAMKSPPGSPLRIGKWAIYGVGEGYQEGREGKSYAIPTVTKPGAKKSISRRDIFKSLLKLGEFAKKHPKLIFFCCISGGGYNGWSVKEIQEIYTYWISRGIPENISIPENYAS